MHRKKPVLCMEVNKAASRKSTLSRANWHLIRGWCKRRRRSHSNGINSVNCAVHSHTNILGILIRHSVCTVFRVMCSSTYKIDYAIHTHCPTIPYRTCTIGIGKHTADDYTTNREMGKSLQFGDNTYYASCANKERCCRRFENIMSSRGVFGSVFL